MLQTGINLVSEISSDEETLFYFSIDPDKVQWTSNDQEYTCIINLALMKIQVCICFKSCLLKNGIVVGVEFFSPVENDEVTAQRALACSF